MSLRRRAPRMLLPCLAALAALAGPAAAQPAAAPAPEAEEPSAEQGEPEEPPPGPADALNRQTPRRAMRAYLEAARAGDWERAARYLDLAPVPEAQRAARGPELARHLKIVLDQKLWVELDRLSDEVEGKTDDGLPAGRDRVGNIETEAGAVPIELARVPIDGVRLWQLAASTVREIPSLYEQFGYGPLGGVLPPVFFESRFLEIALWQWLGLLLAVLVAYVVSYAVVWLVVRLARPALQRTEAQWDDELLELTLGPARLVVSLLIASGALRLLSLSIPAQRFFEGAIKALTILAATWVVLRLIDLFGTLVTRRLESRGQASATTFVPLGRRTVKAVVVVLAVLAGLDTMGFDVTAVIAGLGIGGLAVALGLQKTLENFFGGITLIADRPVQVGDFCRFGDRVGVVEDIGLRSTRVRTLDRTLVTVSNAEFSTMQLENYSKRDRIWYHPTIGLRYETTPDQLRYILVEVRKMLYAHPKVDPAPARIRFTGFGAYSLDLEIFAYVYATDYGVFLEIAEDLNLRIMDIVEAAGSGFAFPSTTTYVGRDDGLDAERAGQATSAVKEWREKGEMMLPGFPEEKIRELDDTLDYPPEGSALRGRT